MAINLWQGGIVKDMGNYVVGEKGREFMIPRSWIDYFGFVTSFLCAIHCIVTPFLVMFLPIIGSYFVFSYGFEIIFVICSIILAFFSICWGYRLHKSNQLFLYLFVASGFLLIGELFFHGNFYGYVLLGAGGLTLGLVHLINLKLCKSCDHC